MLQITLKQYLKGRDVLYSKEYTNQIENNAIYTVNCVNKLYELMNEDGIDTTNSACNSGWRPKSVNAATPGSDPNSPHITAEAYDGADPDDIYKKWIGQNPDKVKQAGFIATESFSLTNTWFHVQTRKPLSFQQGKAIWLASDDGWVNNFSKQEKDILV